MRLFFDFYFTGGGKKEVEIKQEFRMTEAEIDETIEEFSEVFYEAFKAGEPGAFKTTTGENKLFVVNLQKVDYIEFRKEE
ncbi:hypothetical protein DCC85_11830 [Paenibacillus sp. CAA11]|uniref:hypothetical protein n=1 Tax=Paenibacillus sp. CAA11 TaxID=1532905 RepID=UPI000D36D294|nr:hypothetical protein [Paenibacillus sp. CAA11]AWB44838.1 hypothetical protein DCC85_11830 [Paenibacillus sp. CAA11]